jgi:flagellar basal-body rod modification protein FlgD
MTTNSVGSSGSSTTTSSSSVPPNLNLNTGDFLNMMMKQLENQDPLNPTNSDQLMSQMSAIGQMESSSNLDTTLSNLGTQTQIGSASSLMGKQVQGIDLNNNSVTGVVTAVQVASTGVSLQLDSGDTLALSNISSITSATSGS